MQGRTEVYLEGNRVVLFMQRRVQDVEIAVFRLNLSVDLLDGFFDVRNFTFIATNRETDTRLIHQRILERRWRRCLPSAVPPFNACVIFSLR